MENRTVINCALNPDARGIDVCVLARNALDALSLEQRNQKHALTNICTRLVRKNALREAIGTATCSEELAAAVIRFL